MRLYNSFVFGLVEVNDSMNWIESTVVIRSTLSDGRVVLAFLQFHAGEGVLEVGAIGDVMYLFGCDQ